MNPKNLALLELHQQSPPRLQSHTSMPRYYCDYCDMYLTKDSAGGRKEHSRGWKHRENVIAFFKPSLKHFMTSGEGNTWQGWQNSQKGGQGPPPLPPGWTQHTTSLSKHESARPYYVHTASGITTWTHPRLLKSHEMPENGGQPGKSWQAASTAPGASAPQIQGGVQVQRGNFANRGNPNMNNPNNPNQRQPPPRFNRGSEQHLALSEAKFNRVAWTAFLMANGLASIGNDPSRHDATTLIWFYNTVPAAERKFDPNHNTRQPQFPITNSHLGSAPRGLPPPF